MLQGNQGNLWHCLRSVCLFVCSQMEVKRRCHVNSKCQSQTFDSLISRQQELVIYTSLDVKSLFFPFILPFWLHLTGVIDMLTPFLWIRVVPNSSSSESYLVSSVSEKKRKILVKFKLGVRGCKRTSGVIKTIEVCLWPVRLYICVLPDKSRSPRVCRWPTSMLI